jgi:hypothetical protein
MDGVDPLAYKMPSYSPFSFSFNNPVRFIDPDGRAPFDITLLGANNSSVTVKTDLVDLKINASGLGVDFGGNYTLSGNDVLQAAVDIGGVFDPTPTLDILGASLSAKSGDDWGAAASGLGAAVPYVGDLAKTGKIAKGIDKISDAIDAAKSESKAFGAAVDTESRTAKQAFNKAKDQNGIPRSQQPKSQYMTPDTKTGKPLRTYDFTNSKGELKTIRKDNPVTYPDGGKQGPHYNAGKTGNKLKQHHNYE